MATLTQPKPTALDKFLQPQVSAYKLAIEALEDYRRSHYADAHDAYKRGLQADEVNGDGITGIGFAWVAEGEAHYQEYTKAISEMHDLLEMMEDSEVTQVTQLQMALDAA